MSSRPQVGPYSVITDGDMSSSLISKVTIIRKLSELSYSIAWNGTAPVGVISVQVSNDFAQNSDGTIRNSGSWNTLPLSAPTNVSGNVDNGFIDIDASGAYAVRLIYTAASGTGLLNVVVTGKVG